jgi:hypothetical protein
MKILSIDPGVNSGWAIGDKKFLYTCGVTDVIKFQNSTGKNKKKLDLDIIVKRIKDEFITHILLEKVNVMPKQGICGAWSFASGFFPYCGIAAALGLPIIEIPPTTWTRFYHFPNAEKEHRINKVKELFQVKVKHNVADAILLLHYFQKNIEKELSTINL